MKKYKIKPSWILWDGGIPLVINPNLAKILLKEGYVWKYGRYEIAANKSHPKENPQIEGLKSK